MGKHICGFSASQNDGMSYVCGVTAGNTASEPNGRLGAPRSVNAFRINSERVNQSHA
jgi:hypothetical protein